ncbi:hypothetical protein predicted by Glimmer/Critica (plasmid) [Sinorhizobium fredii HH103]|uniref:Uncharacterized protein n=1 Tax=Sinorhizobium fredii (strain HH103) TaxID=1117943 RepID=G9AFE7_SINF1|nr:hypothetical protein predicted by Glimmer/Critica [Sinorhizobium fredii HH103]
MIASAAQCMSHEAEARQVSGSVASGRKAAARASGKPSRWHDTQGIHAQGCPAPTKRSVSGLDGVRLQFED